MSFGASSGGSNTVTQIDPQLKADWEQLYGQARTTADQPTPVQQVAPITPRGQLGQDMTANVGTSGVGQGQLDAATHAALGVANFAAPSIGGDTSRAAPDPGMFSYRMVQAPGFSGSALQDYLNPYNQDVYNTTMGDLDVARQRQQVSDHAGAALNGGEGAWDGSRAGVDDALSNEAFYRQAGQLAAQLHQQGYDAATGLMKDYGQMGLAAETADQNADLARDNTIYGGALSTGQANQAAINDLAKTGAADAIAAAGLNLSGAGELGTLGPAAQALALTGANAVSGVGQQELAQQQAVLNADYQNQMNQRNLPLQTVESAFGIIPTTSNGGSTTTHSSGKSGGV
jgi:hypothetical protein